MTKANGAASTSRSPADASNPSPCPPFSLRDFDLLPSFLHPEGGPEMISSEKLYRDDSKGRLPASVSRCALLWEYARKVHYSKTFSD